MVSSKATTVAGYLSSLPSDRRAVIAAVRDLVNANLPDGFVEGMLSGMIAWYVPLEVSGDTYNGQALGIAGLAAQKHYNSLYLMAVYSDPATERWFKKAYADSGKKPDLGKCCVRFKSLDALPLDVIAETIKKVPLDKFLADYEAIKGPEKKPKSARALREKETAKPKPKAKAKPKPKPKKRR